MNPQFFFTNITTTPNNAVNSQAFITKSGGNFAGSTIAPASSGGALTTGVSQVGATSSFLSSQVSNLEQVGGVNTIQYRLVSAGLRIMWAGTELNKGGFICGMHHPQHGTLDNDSSALLLANPEATWTTFTKSPNWVTVRYSVVDTDDNDYYSTPIVFNSDGSTPVVNNGSQPGNDYMGFLLTGCTASTSIAYEAVANLEVVGSASSTRTPSIDDPVGYAAVQNALSSTLHMRQPTDHSIRGFGGEMVKLVGDALVSTASGVVANVMPHAIAWGSQVGRSMFRT